MSLFSVQDYPLQHFSSAKSYLDIMSMMSVNISIATVNQIKSVNISFLFILSVCDNKICWFIYQYRSIIYCCIMKIQEPQPEWLYLSEKKLSQSKPHTVPLNARGSDIPGMDSPLLSPNLLAESQNNIGGILHVPPVTSS